jgi:hypothetical protein
MDVVITAENTSKVQKIDWDTVKVIRLVIDTFGHTRVRQHILDRGYGGHAPLIDACHVEDACRELALQIP